MSLHSKIKTIFFSLLPGIILLLIIEIILRTVGFKYSQTPLEMKQTELKATGVVSIVMNWDNRGNVIRFIKDPYQLWVPVEPFAKGRLLQKDPQTTRIASLGDSCTASCIDTTETYPSLMEKIANLKLNKKIEVLNAGVGSYSSFQGLKRFKHVVLPYKPDVITVFFGWNDHWVTFQEDKNVKFPNEFLIKLVNTAEKFRGYQFLNYLLTRKRNNNETLKQSLRVRPEDYKSNLDSIIDLAQENNIKIILMTAPHNLSNFEPTSYFPYSKEILLPLHKKYNAVVRLVAKERNIPLVDLEALAVNQDSVISTDGIHFTPFGCQFVAKAVLERLMEEGLLK